MPEDPHPKSLPEEEPVTPSTTMVLHGLVVDDDLLFADLLAEEITDILPRLIDVTVCANPNDALEHARRQPPDIAFVDVVFREGSISGFDLATELHALAPESKIVIVSAAAAPGWETTLAMADAVLAHAVQYLKKDIRRTEFVNALTSIVEGFEDLPRIVAERLREHASPPGGILPRRELEVLDLIARGSTAKGVSERLHISARTVNDYTEHARLRLGAKTTTEAVAIAIQRGLIPLT